MKRLAVFLVLLTGALTLAATTPPAPSAHFYGDANGDTIVSLADQTQHSNTILLKPATYDTLQPLASNADTCDVNSDNVCSLGDKTIISNVVLLKAVGVADDPWAIDVSSIPTTVAPSSLTAFQVSLSSRGGLNGRPGMPVVATIESGSGTLNGRDCAPVAGTRDQPVTGQACALSVTITDWALDATAGPTETGATGFAFNAPASGDTRILFTVNADPKLDIPLVTTSVLVSVLGGPVNSPPTVTLTCPASVEETRDIDCNYTVSDSDVPAQNVTVAVDTLLDTCGGALISGIYRAVSTEAQGPGTCVAAVIATDDGVPPASGTAQATVIVTEINATPSLTLNCPASVGEGSDIVCNMVASDPDLPANTLTLTKHASDTCGGTIVGSDYTAPTTETQGPGSCLVVVTLSDDGTPVRTVTRGSTVVIDEVNSAPTVTVSCPASAPEDAAASCALSTTDGDLPAQGLTCSLDASSTCAGLSITGCSSVDIPAQGEAAPASCTVVVNVSDDGSPILSGQGSATVAIDEVNANPIITVTCPANVAEDTATSCALSASDGDLPAQGLTCSAGAGTTCSGVSVIDCTQVDVAAQGEASGPGSCVVFIDVTDSLGGTGQSSDAIVVDEVNASPTLSVDCPATVSEDATAICAISASDGDVPAQNLTCTIDGSSTCVGLGITGCSTVEVAAQGEAAPASCTVVVNVADDFAPAGTAQASDSMDIEESNLNPTVTVDCPVDSAENAGFSCSLTASDGDLPPQSLSCMLGAGTTCTGVTVVDCATVNVAAQGESGGPGSCIVVVDVIDGASGLGSGSDTVAITEVNAAPSISISCPVSVSEGSLINCSATPTDPDVPAQALTVTVDTLTDTCGGSVIGTSYTAGTVESQGPGSCVVGLTVSDDGSPVLQASASATVGITETNSAPSVALACPPAVEFPNPISCSLTLTDSDVPANTLTAFVDGLYDTCGGTLVGGVYTAPVDGLFWPPTFCTVAVGVLDNGLPVLDGYAMYDVYIAPQVTLPPVLSWTIEPNYVFDGVDNQYGAAGYGVDNAGLSGDQFTFRVLYTSELVAMPIAVGLELDRNNDGDYLDLNENIVMTCVGDCSSNDFTLGRAFTTTTTIVRGSTAYVGAGPLNYRFYATDGLGRPATSGDPVSASVVTARHNPAELVILGKTALEAEPTAGTAGLLNVQALFFEAERIEDPAAIGSINNYPSYPPIYPDASFLDSKWGAAIADVTLWCKLFWNGLDWSHHEWSMEYWISTQMMPVVDRVIARLDVMEADAGFAAWTFHMNRSLRIQLNNNQPLMGAVIELELGLRHSGGEWDGSEVYMLEAMMRGFRGIAEFLQAYGIRSVDSGYGYDDFLAMLTPENDMMAYHMAALNGTTPVPQPNHIDDDNDGIVDDIGAIGRIFSRFPEFATYTGGPNGTELEEFRVDMIEALESMKSAVLFVESETDDQSDDIWLIWKDCGLDGLCPADVGYAGADADGSEANGVYDKVDANGDGFSDIDWGTISGNFLPGGFSPVEPLEINHNGAAYDSMITSMFGSLAAMLADFGIPIDLGGGLPEEYLIAWIYDFTTPIKISLQGTRGLDWRQEIDFVMGLFEFISPGLGIALPPEVYALVADMNFKVALDLHPNLRETYFPAYLPESAQKGDILFGFVGDWSEKWDPAVTGTNGKGILYRIEPYFSLELDANGNPTGNILNGFTDLDADNEWDFLEPFADLNLDKTPDHYIDLNNDGDWSGWNDFLHNSVPATNGGIGWHNPLYIYFGPNFLGGALSGDEINLYLGLILDIMGGVQIVPPANNPPANPAITFDSPLVALDATNAMVSESAGPVTMHITSTDPNGDARVYSLLAGHGATITTASSQGNITWNPAGHPGTNVFVVSIYDGKDVISGWITFTFTVTVSP